jgi:hypothetical protein
MINKRLVLPIAAQTLLLAALIARCGHHEDAIQPTVAAALTAPSSPPRTETSKELTRAEAERLIRATKRFPEAVTVKVRVGDLTRCDDRPNPTAEYVAAGLESVSGEQRVADRFHLICSGDTFIKYSASITERGKPYLVDEPGLTLRDRQIRGLDGGEYVLAHACDRAFFQITGVKSEGTTAVAEYTTKLVTPTPFAGEACRESALKTEQERFQKWDDGWRVAQ